MADPLSVAGSLVGIISLGIRVTQFLVDFYEACKGQKSDVANIATKLTRLLNVLKSLHRQLTDRNFRVEKQDLLKHIEGSIEACEDNIRELLTRVEKFKGSSGDSIQAAIRTATRQLAYPFKQSTLRKLEADIDEIVSHLTLALQVLQGKNISNVQNDIEDVKELLDLVRADQVTSTIREWLKAPDATVNYNEAYIKKHPGTGLWFVRGSSFSAWLAKPKSFLWLKGFAGCGKSVLCSTAIQYTLRHRRSNPRVGIGFFFFTFNDKSKQDASAMLRALVLQLSSQLTDNYELLSRFYDCCRNATPSDPTLLDCLHQLVQAFEHVYVIIDALDESPRNKCRRAMLQTLVDIWAWSEPGLHLLVSSRDETDLHDAFHEELHASSDEVVSIENDSVHSDIASYVSSYLKDSREFRRWQKYHGQIEKALVERANGVFRWVECQFTALESCPGSKRRLDTLLASLPRSLDETYERMLLNIDEESAEDARRILTLLCYAKRPLTVLELIDGVAVELGNNPQLNPDGRLLGRDELRRVCPGLIEVDTQLEDEAATVRIAHFSVQEYLESRRIVGSKAAIFSIQRLEAHADIASICLTYLLEPALSKSRDPRKEYPLAAYAARTWPKHLRNGGETPQYATKQALRLFQSSGGEFENWVTMWNVDDFYGKKPRGEVPSPVYYASLLGLNLILSKLLHENPLGTACFGLGISEVSNLVNAQGGNYGNALQAASAEGHEKIVQLLLEKNADVNAQGGSYGNALHAASIKGHEKIVRLLLENNADINTQGGNHGTALQAASVVGHEKIVQLLLDNNANINAQSGRFGNALQAASFMGHEKIVRLLLENNADINAHGRKYGNALQAASYMGYERIIRLLLENNADINAQGGKYGNALQVASLEGHENIIRLFLKNNANVNAQVGKYGNALQAASLEGYEKIVRLLLENNADVNAQGGKYGSALQAASSKGHEKIVKLLLNNADIDVNAQGGKYGDALQAASSEGHETIVQLLLKMNAR